MANSRNRRPTTSPINNSGISTAIREKVREMMVKPICCDPFNAASSGGSPASAAGNILDHHDRVVDHKTVAIVSAISDRLLRLKREIHHAKGSHQRKRYRRWGSAWPPRYAGTERSPSPPAQWKASAPHWTSLMEARMYGYDRTGWSFSRRRAARPAAWATAP